MEGAPNEIYVDTLFKRPLEALHGPHLGLNTGPTWAPEPLQIADIGACGKQNDPRCACPSGQEGAPFVGEYTAHT